jgi:predicted metal-dependent hydrolase
MSVFDELPDTLFIGDLLFQVRESDNRSTVGITVDRDGSLLLHAPAGQAADAIAAWAYSKRMWVYRKLAEKDLLLSSRPMKEFVTGEGFAYLGRSYRLLLDDCDTVRLERGRLMMPRHEVRSGDAAAALIRWYRSRGQEWLLRRIRPWARRMAVEPAGLDIRDLGYRWGSLSKNGQLNVHWSTLQLSPALIDYVLVHELSHIKHPQHTPAFWATVERALPDYERRKADLIVVGAKLWMG